MKNGQYLIRAVAVLAVLGLTACSGGRIGSGSIGSASGSSTGSGGKTNAQANAARVAAEPQRSTIWDLFKNNDDPNVTIKVNKYIWFATHEVLNFLPIEASDPFTGVLVTGYGTPPGGGRAYKARVYVQDPALDARSLNIALRTRSGPVSADTVHAIENAILTRARQLRIRDGNL